GPGSPGVHSWASILRDSALEDRQVAVGNLQDDQRHGRAVLVADRVLPVARGGLAMDQFVADGGIPVVPLLSAADPHGLVRVIMAVEVVAVAVAQLDLSHVLAE